MDAFPPAVILFILLVTCVNNDQKVVTVSKSTNGVKKLEWS